MLLALSSPVKFSKRVFSVRNFVQSLKSYYKTIGHFRITSGLAFEASLGAHLFICKINFHSHENEFNLRVNGNCFAYERMSTKTRFENEA